jgi:hypothetical protein
MRRALGFFVLAAVLPGASPARAEWAIDLCGPSQPI